MIVTFANPKQTELKTKRVKGLKFELTSLNYWGVEGEEIGLKKFQIYFNFILVLEKKMFYLCNRFHKEGNWG